MFFIHVRDEPVLLDMGLVAHYEIFPEPQRRVEVHLVFKDKELQVVLSKGQDAKVEPGQREHSFGEGSGTQHAPRPLEEQSRFTVEHNHERKYVTILVLGKVIQCLDEDVRNADEILQAEVRPDVSILIEYFVRDHLPDEGAESSGLSHQEELIHINDSVEHDGVEDIPEQVEKEALKQGLESRICVLGRLSVDSTPNEDGKLSKLGARVQRKEDTLKHV
mmetsp:Transcript_14879/g.14464  ORF Transcript_14879/g.14464 Transcript_14879/m.14464 type:complete len:220 (-) Transcript_14879:73-732(-)